MKYLDVCSGISAPTVAWRPLGWEAAAYAEVAPFACAVLHQHYGCGRPLFMPAPSKTPGHGYEYAREYRARTAAIKAVQYLPEKKSGLRNFGDLERFKEWPNVPALDVLIGGTPCQSFSLAGLRKGLTDPRGNLALVYLAIAERYRPEWVVWENVPGVLSSNEGEDFSAFLGGLAELGYHGSYRVLDAQFVRVDGFGRAVPQRRRRVFVVANSRDWRRAAAVLFDPESMRGDSPPRREAGAGIANALAARAGGGGQPDGGDGQHSQLIPEVAWALQERDAKGADSNTKDGHLIPTVAASISSGSKGGRSGGRRPGTDGDTAAESLIPIPFDTTQITHPENRSKPKPGDPAPSLAKRGHPPAIAFSAKDHGADADEELSPTLRSGNFDKSHANGGVMPAVAYPLVTGEGKTYTHEGSGNFKLRIVVPQAFKPAHYTRGKDGAPSDVFPALSADADNGDQDPVIFQPRFARNDRGAPDTVASALTGEAGTSGKGDSAQCVAAAWGVRRLMPIECERLQGYPDGYTDVPYRNKNHAADGPRYNVLGNTMAVNCIRWLGVRIELVRSVVAELEGERRGKTKGKGHASRNGKNQRNASR